MLSCWKLVPRVNEKIRIIKDKSHAVVAVAIIRSAIIRSRERM